jgi:hypothetical protein
MPIKKKEYREGREAKENFEQAMKSLFRAPKTQGAGKPDCGNQGDDAAMILDAAIIGVVWWIVVGLCFVVDTRMDGGQSK